MKTKTYAWMLDDNWTEYFDFFQTEADRKKFDQHILSYTKKQVAEHPNARFIIRISSEPELCIAELLLELKQSNPDLRVELLTPQEELTNTWPDAIRERYFEASYLCDSEHIVERHLTAKNVEKQYHYLLHEADEIILFTEEWGFHSPEVVFFLPSEHLLS